MESDHCSCATADGQCLLEPDASRRLAIFELVEPLEESDDDVLLEVWRSVYFRGSMDLITRGSAEGNFGR